MKFDPNDERKMHEWAEQHNKLWDLECLTAGIEAQANAVLKKHNRDGWREVKDDDLEPLRLAGNALFFLELMQNELDSGNMEAAAVRAMKAGACAAGLPGAQRLQARLSRTKTTIVDRIRELRKKGYSPKNIGTILNEEEFKKTSGKPFNENDVKGYMRRQKIG